ncbi:Olfactory receptor 5M11 [Heterocephalus glaber]|uniref:Olfactory receptor 5M11 n=1 Tax=Heterocephalus glaber TaxID=10181 RepID=G5C8M7_HETGA|nr:Olfactory receptor 5M11 [Heterocephalus glaber]
MSLVNTSTLTEFVLLQLMNCLDLQPLLFLLVYLITMLGNLGMVVLIRLDLHLHTPMYFFLTHLALGDFCYTCNATPQMLANFLSDTKTISFEGCFTQCYIFIALLLMEFYMLAAMAYDHYVAICNLLCYSVRMSRIILVSYTFIIAAILKIRSTEERCKAFSTCGSHMVAVTLFYGTQFCMYVRPPTDENVEQSKIIAVSYTFINSVLHSLIYSLRNKDVKQALKNVIRKNIVRTVTISSISHKS